MILALVETTSTASPVEVSLEAMTFARPLSAAGGGVPIDAVVVGEVSDELREQLAAYGVREVHQVGARAFASYSGAGWAAGVQSVRAAARSRSW